MEPRKYNAKTIVDLMPAAVEAAMSRLPSDEIKVLGEVISIRRAGAFTELTLLDTKDDSFSITARLPSGLPVPELGHIAGIVGRLKMEHDGTGFALFVDGNAHDGRTIPGKLYAARRECFAQQLRATAESKVAEVPWPLPAVALVTGAQSRAEMDLRSGLNPRPEQDRRSPPQVRVRLYPVNLRDPADIAAGIARAAADAETQVVVIARGGGSPLDLHRFNAAEVLTAIGEAVQRKFVLTAIGHAEDTTWADALASHSEPVPAAAGSWLRQTEIRKWKEHQLAQAGLPTAWVAPAPALPLRLVRQRRLRHGSRWMAWGILLTFAVSAWCFVRLRKTELRPSPPTHVDQPPAEPAGAGTRQKPTHHAPRPPRRTGVPY